jgi:hypothetical protein
MKCPDSKTETLDIEEFVEFFSVEIELWNFKTNRNLPSPLLPGPGLNLNPP